MTKTGKWIIDPIMHQNEIVGVDFIDENGQTISVGVNFNFSDYITISGDDCLIIMPWATNKCLIKHTDI